MTAATPEGEGRPRALQPQDSFPVGPCLSLICAFLPVCFLAGTVLALPTVMENPYFALHREFKAAGADVLISSGQACVAFGIATFSKDGDWIIREDQRSCDAVLGVLGKHHADYRLGVPLHPDWLRRGLTSHFEFQSAEGMRIRADFCSRPPRVTDLERMWACSVSAEGVDVVDVESLIHLKQTRRVRDYSMVGALAEVAGLEGNTPEVALRHLQDYELLAQAVRRWPAQAAQCDREAVRLLHGLAPRPAVVAAIAVEQDALMQADQARLAAIEAQYGDYTRSFGRLRATWRKAKTGLAEQHRELMLLAQALREAKA